MTVGMVAVLNVFRICAVALVPFLIPSPAAALSLNGYRAQHHRPPLHMSVTLAGEASAHAWDMARRGHLDHDGFRESAALRGTTSAQNVLFGCANEDCAIRMWAKSSRHRANMLRKDVSAYGIGSATADNGQRYWVLELGGE